MDYSGKGSSYQTGALLLDNWMPEINGLEGLRL